jgi:Ca2+-binding EF-hand superfamily protein
MILASDGSKVDKIKAAFEFYDSNNNNTLDIQELTDYFEGTIKLSSIGKNIDN